MNKKVDGKTDIDIMAIEIQSGKKDLFPTLVGKMNNLLRYNANRMQKNSRIDYDDAYQCCLLGLSIAIEKYDITKGPFINLYYTYERRERLKVLSQMLYDVYLPIGVFEKVMQKVNSGKFNDIIPNEDELSKRRCATEFLENTFKRIEDQESNLHTDQWNDCFEYDKLKKAVRSLPERERFVIVRLFGLDGNGERSKEEIGTILKRSSTSTRKPGPVFSTRYVGKIAQRGLWRLRSILGENYAE